MKRKNLFRSIILSLTIFIVFIMGADFMGDTKEKSSTDVGELSKIIHFEIPYKKIRWEIFQTPEYTGGIPAPNDFETLVAEIELGQDAWWDTNRLPIGKTIVVPEAPRPWLSSSFQQLLRNHPNGLADFSGNPHCRAYSSILKTDKRRINGFVCHESGRILLYLTLWSSLQTDARDE